MNRIKIQILSLFLFFAYSCLSQDKQYIDLENISIDFNVSNFYQSRLESTQNRLATNPKVIEKKSARKLLSEPFFVKDTLGFFKTGGRLPTELSLEATNDWMTRNKKATEIFGYKYKTVAYQETDTLAILNTVAFPQVNMVENIHNQLMFLQLEKNTESTKDFQKIQDYFVKNFEKIDVEDRKANTSYFKNDTFFIILTNNQSTKEKLKSFDSLGEPIYELINVTNIYLEMYSKSYLKQMENQNIYSKGNTFWFKD